MDMTEEIEKIFIIPLRTKGYASSTAAPIAMKRVKNYLIKHMKTTKENIWIDDSLNHEIWKHGKYKMPNKIRVKAVKFEDGVVEAYLPELTFEKSRREILQEEKSKKQPILRKEEKVEEGEEEETGAEAYSVVPASDGEVKIKKKKQQKEGAGEGKESIEIVTPQSETEKVKEIALKEKPSPKKKKTEKKPSEKKEKKAPSKKTKKESK